MNLGPETGFRTGFRPAFSRRFLGFETSSSAAREWEACSVAAACDNPFSARRLRPDARPYLFAEEYGLAELLDRLRVHGWGEITGPHGSGKSTLLATLEARLQAAGWYVLHLALDARGTGLAKARGTGFASVLAVARWLEQVYDAISLAEPMPHRQGVLVAIDGYEQMGRFTRFGLKWLCRRRGAGLVVTAHQPVGLPLLVATGINLSMACRVAEQLQEGYRRLVTPSDVAAAWQVHGDNLREAFFALYDVYARRAAEPWGRLPDLP
jgi:hypothetical protein